MPGLKRMLLGIAVIFAGLAAATRNLFAWVGAAVGLLLVLSGFFTGE